MKPGASKPGARRSEAPRLPLVVAGLGAASILLAAWLELSPPWGPPPVTAEASEGAYSAINYEVSAADWGATAPRLCDIVNRYRLDSDAFAATLHLNRGGARCAAPATRVQIGRRIPLAVTARSGFGQCGELARRPC
jgi:hypothetical protein